MTRALLLLAGISLLGAKTQNDGSEPKTPEDYMMMSMIMLDANDPGGAEETLRTGAKKFPKSAGFHFFQGNINVAKNKYFDAFMEYQWELLKLGGDREVGAMAAQKSQELMERRGTEIDEIRRVTTALQTKDAKKSLSELQAVAKDRPDRFILQLYLAEANVRNGDTASAEATYRKLMGIDPMFVPVYVNLAELLEKRGKAADGKTLRAKAKSIDPAHWRLK